MPIGRRGAVLFATLLVLTPAAARADWPYAFVQVTCAPELHYFAIRRFSVWNLPAHGPYLTRGLSAGPSAIAEVRRRHGVYDSASLVRRAARCVAPPLPARGGWDSGRPGFEVSITGRVASGGSDYSHMMDQVEVHGFGRLLAILQLSPFGLAHGDDSFELAADGVGLTLRRCAVVEGQEQLRRCFDSALPASGGSSGRR